MINIDMAETYTTRRTGYAIRNDHKTTKAVEYAFDKNIVHEKHFGLIDTPRICMGKRTCPANRTVALSFELLDEA